MATDALLKLVAKDLLHKNNETMDRISDAIVALKPEMQEYNNRTPDEILQDALKQAQNVDVWLRAMSES